MKKTIKTTTMAFAALALTLGLTFTACKKGDTGPAGAAGTNGTNGSSNVQSFTVTTNNASWTLDNSDNSYNATLNVTAITAAVLNGGTIQVYLGNGTSTQWFAMPFAYQTVQYNYSYDLGHTYLSVTLANSNAPNNPGGQQFKVVVIPAAARVANPNVNLKNYDDVKKAYNLAD